MQIGKGSVNIKITILSLSIYTLEISARWVASLLHVLTACRGNNITTYISIDALMDSASQWVTTGNVHKVPTVILVSIASKDCALILSWLELYVSTTTSVADKPPVSLVILL